MSAESIDRVQEAQAVEAATGILTEHGIPPVTREFRLRQEFFRHGWDVRVRDESTYWAVHATKPGHDGVDVTGTTEGIVLRLALAKILTAEATTST